MRCSALYAITGILALSFGFATPFHVAIHHGSSPMAAVDVYAPDSGHHHGPSHSHAHEHIHAHAHPDHSSDDASDETETFADKHRSQPSGGHSEHGHSHSVTDHSIVSKSQSNKLSLILLAVVSPSGFDVGCGPQHTVSRPETLPPRDSSLSYLPGRRAPPALS